MQTPKIVFYDIKIIRVLKITQILNSFFADFELLSRTEQPADLGRSLCSFGASPEESWQANRGVQFVPWISGVPQLEPHFQLDAETAEPHPQSSQLVRRFQLLLVLISASFLSHNFEFGLLRDFKQECAQSLCQSSSFEGENNKISIFLCVGNYYSLKLKEK